MNSLIRTNRLPLVAAVLAVAVTVSPGVAPAADYWWNGTTNSYTSQNWESPSGTPTAATPASWDSVYNTKGGKVTLNVTANPGYFRFASGELEIGTGGTLNPNGSGGGSISTGPATITINGGTLTGAGPSGPNASGAVLNLRAGSWTRANSGVSSASLGGRINHTGGTLTVGSGSTLQLGIQDSWSNSNGDYYFGNADGSSGTMSGVGSLIVGNISFKMNGSQYQRTTYGSFIGHGTVGLSGTLRNNGYIIADGYGQDRTLNLSSFSSVANTIGNDEYSLVANNNFYFGKGGTGWFAVNRGSLLLPSIAVATGAGAYNWGEASGDTDIDLINSLRLNFADVTAAGSMSISLLAADRSELGISSGTVLGAWSILAPTLDFTTADLTVRYNDVLANSLSVNQNNLRLFGRVGSSWIDITSGVDTTKKQITATNVDSLSMLAVGIAIVPEPGSVATVGIGGLAMLLLGRRLRAKSCQSR